MSKFSRKCFPIITDDEWNEYEYLYDLILVEKRNPYLMGYHPKEELYELLKKIAECNISCQTLRTGLITLLEEKNN